MSAGSPDPGDSHRRRSVGSGRIPSSEVSDLRRPPGIVFCLCPHCHQTAVWDGIEYQALCTRCEGYACTNDQARCF